MGTADGDMSLNTWLNYRWALSPAIEMLGTRRLAELEPEHVEALLARLAREGKSRRSVTRVRTVLGQALDMAMRRDEVSRNVARLAEMPKDIVATRETSAHRLTRPKRSWRLRRATRSRPSSSSGS